MIPRRETPVDESLHDRYGSFILRHESTATTSWFQWLLFFLLLPYARIHYLDGLLNWEKVDLSVGLIAGITINRPVN